MAVTKEAIAIVLDVGKNMHDGGKFPTVLDNAKECISMIIQRKIFSESKDELALILFGSYGTSNKLSQEYTSEYENIEVIRSFAPASWELLEYVNSIQGTDICSDFIDALVVAMDVLYSKMNNEKVISKQILFFSNFESNFSTHRLDTICHALKNTKMELNIIGPVAFSDVVKNDSCMPMYHERNLIHAKAENMLCKILREVNGESYSFSEAIPALMYYQKKKIQQIPWNANLDIGTNLTIPISAYIKVNETKVKTWKTSYAHKLNAKIERLTTYLLNDESQTKVSADNIISAYKYGTTLVPYSEEDKVNMDYQSGEKGLKVLGFTKVDNVQRYHYVGDKTMYIFGQKNRELGGVILAPFIQALHDTKMVAIVRYVRTARSAPTIGFLAPRIKPTYECLVFITLPFMEDLRHFVFTPLNAVSSNVPTDEQLNAIDDLISAMDLSSVDEDEDGNKEALKPKDTMNPYIQRIYQCLQYRAFNPEKPLPEIPPNIKSLLTPLPELVKRAAEPLGNIRRLFPLTEVVQKKVQDSGYEVLFSSNADESTRKRKNSVDIGPETKFMAIDAMTDVITQVGTANPVKDVQYLLNSETASFSDVCKQALNVVYQYLQNSSSLSLYHSKIISLCKELRQASIKRNEPSHYNCFIKNLQELFLERDVQLCVKIQSENVGLISNVECATSCITAEEAETFLSMSVPCSENVLKIESYNINDEVDYESLLQEL